MGKRRRYGPWVLTGQSAGGGGQADVLLAHRYDDPQKTVVALKRLRNPSRIARFRKEIEAGLRLDHANIIRIIDYSLDEPAYIVMPYYPRGSLSFDNLRSLSLLQRLQIFASICAALGHAHANGVTHRDIKPDNILVTDGGDHVVVSDFGVCHIKGEDRPTEMHEVIRNWMCTAPELEDGILENVSHAADVYCLGKLLYWMLSGEFFGRERQREERCDLTRREPRLGHILIYELLDRMIVREPTARLQDARQVSDALELLRKRIEMNAHAIDLEAPQPCAYCGQGEYQIVVDPRWWIGNLESEKSKGATALFNLGLNLNTGTAVLVLVCDFCANLQIFKPTHARKGHRGGIGNWTPKGLR